eukprot:754766-Prymnesium_polylepis.1
MQTALSCQGAGEDANGVELPGHRGGCKRRLVARAQGRMQTATTPQAHGHGEGANGGPSGSANARPSAARANGRGFRVPAE